MLTDSTTQTLTLGRDAIRQIYRLLALIALHKGTMEIKGIVFVLYWRDLVSLANSFYILGRTHGLPAGRPKYCAT